MRKVQKKTVKKKHSIFKYMMTDTDNETFDIGRTMVFVVVLSMMFFEGWDIIVHNAKFDAQSFGTGVGTLLVGLGAYIFGDKKGTGQIGNHDLHDHREDDPHDDHDHRDNEDVIDGPIPQPESAAVAASQQPQQSNTR